MIFRFTWNDREYEFNSTQPQPLGIRLCNGFDRQPNAFYAPPFESSPLISGDFTGSVEAGAPVNFYNMFVNPHGNGTHTECVGHIIEGEYFLGNVLTQSLYMAQLLTVIPTKIKEDRIITAASLDGINAEGVEALIVRTEPNHRDKLVRKYSGTNPPYFSREAMQRIADSGVKHLLTDLPSVDREEDGGSLTNHKIFWEISKKPRLDKTITEMLFVDNTIRDDLYLLDIQALNIELDASPSNPVLYSLTHVK